MAGISGAIAERLAVEIPSARNLPDAANGISTDTPDAALAAHLGLKKDEGRLVSKIDKDSPAARAGLKPLDVLVAIDGKAVPSAVEVVFVREGKRQTVRLSAPDSPK